MSVLGPVAERSVIAERVGLSGESVPADRENGSWDTGGDVVATIGRKQRLSPPVPPTVDR